MLINIHFFLITFKIQRNNKEKRIFRTKFENNIQLYDYTIAMHDIDEKSRVTKNIIIKLV
jgi:hypothetical protein